MTHTVLADLYMPSTKVRTIIYNTALVLSGTALLTLSAKISVHIPFSPLPVTFQTLVVLLLGLLYGSVRGSVTVLAYLLQGLVGIPVFAGAGAGIAYFTGPTAGYLIGFIFATAVLGKCAQRGWDKNYLTTVCAMIIGLTVLFSCGIAWLSCLVGIKNALFTGLLPFIPGEIIKVIIAVGLLPSGWKLINNFKQQ